MDDRASDIQVVGRADERSEEILTPDALAFVEELQRRLGGRRDELLRPRRVRREEISWAATADFLPETREVRTSEWTVAPAPADLVDRRVEITGPPEPKMAINALDQGRASGWPTWEDANTPHWTNVVGPREWPVLLPPKTESHLEARLWNETFQYAQEFLGIPVGTIRATVLIDTIPAAFEMGEILFELRDHASGLNAGR
jgi:malate synthase